MIFQKNILKFWGIFCVVLVMALGAITVAHRWHRIFPSDEVSEIYARFVGTKGLDVSYVKDFRVNDSTTVDVTLIEASLTSAWDQLCMDLGIVANSEIPEEFREDFIVEGAFEIFKEKDTTAASKDDIYVKNLYVYSRYYMNMCVFHSITRQEYDAIMDNEMDKLSD